MRLLAFQWNLRGMPFYDSNESCGEVFALSDDEGTRLDYGIGSDGRIYYGTIKISDNIGSSTVVRGM